MSQDVNCQFMFSKATTPERAFTTFDWKTLNPSDIRQRLIHLAIKQHRHEEKLALWKVLREFGVHMEVTIPSESSRTSS